MLSLISCLFQSEVSQRKDLIARRSQDKYGQIIREFFFELLIAVCSDFSAGERVDYRLKLLNLTKKLAFNRRLKIEFLDGIVALVTVARGKLLVPQPTRRSNIIIYLGHITEVSSQHLTQK